MQSRHCLTNIIRTTRTVSIATYFSYTLHVIYIVDKLIYFTCYLYCWQTINRIMALESLLFKWVCNCCSVDVTWRTYTVSYRVTIPPRCQVHYCIRYHTTWVVLINYIRQIFHNLSKPLDISAEKSDFNLILLFTIILFNVNDIFPALL